MRDQPGRLIATALLVTGSLLFASGGSAAAAPRARDASTPPTTGAAAPPTTGSATPPTTSATSPTTGSGAPSQITLPVTLTGPSTQIAMPPVGLSLEYSTMAADLGTGACPPPALTAELRRLGSPPLALAGLSQDLTVPAEAAPSAPSWESATLFTLPAPFWSQLHCLLSGSGDLLDAGLNLRKGVPAWAALMAAGAASAATNGLEFSLGNEPDLYSLHNYASLTEPLPNGEATAVGLYLQLAAALEPTIGAQPVIGPELARAGSWRRSLPRIITQLHEHTVGVHMYPLSACSGPSAVTIPRLLGSGAADAPRSLAWVVADANAAHVPAIISEANSASCGGTAGVSDSPAAAVWAVRFVLDALGTGFREVRFHFSGGPYDPFLVRDGEVVDRPLESALVALNQWLPVGTSIQTLAHIRGLVATAIEAAPSAPQPSGGGSSATTTSSTPQLILDNEGTKPQKVILSGTSTVQVQLLNATRAGLQTEQLSSTHDRIQLVVAPASVAAIVP